jgi:hypothetical protein
MNVINEIDNKLDKIRNKNKSILDSALTIPISNNYPFTTNGIYLFCGKPGTGKTYYVIRHILICENLFSLPYYDLIIFTSPKKGSDETLNTFKTEISTPILNIPDTEIVAFLKEFVRKKEKYYTICKFAIFGEISSKLLKTIYKHRLFDF